MYGMKKVMLKTLLILLWIFSANALQCLECQDMPSPEDCRIVTTCSSNSQCFVEQFVTSGGGILYNSGCLSTSRCENIGRKRQETVSETDIGACVSCCKEDFCNIEGCGVVARRQPQRPPLCFSCPSQVNPNSCRDVTLCDEDHMCAMIETVTHMWRSECAPMLQCQAFRKAHGNGFCHTCCQDDFCNNYCNKDITKTTTPLTTTSSQIPTVTIFTPTKFITSTLSATVSNLNSSKQTHNIDVTTMNTSTVNIVNKATTDSNTSPQKLKATSTVRTYSSTTIEIIPSATSAHTIPSSTLPKAHRSTLNDISTSPGTFVSKRVSATTRPDTSTATSSSKATTAIFGPINTTFTPNITGNCINRIFDICFVIDSSGSHGKSAFDKELHFVAEVVRNIAKGTKSTTHFCIVSLSTDTHFAVRLKKNHSTDSIINSIVTIPYSTGATNISKGLHMAVHELRHHGRHGVEKEIVLITDEKSNYSSWTLHDRQNMQRFGISLYAVGIGTQTNSSELQTIVTDKNHLLEVPDADHLNTSFVNILQLLCGCNCKNGNVTDILQSSSTPMSPTTKPMNRNTSLTTESLNLTKSVNSTVATGLTSSASNGTGTTENNMHVTSVDPKTAFKTSIATGVTGSKSVTVTDVYLQTSPTAESPTTQTSPTAESPTTQTSTTAESPTTQTSTTAESPTTQTSTTAESPTTQTSTTAESPTTQTSTTAESPTTQTSTTAESPTTQTSTTAESPTTQTSPTAESPTTQTSTTAESPTTQTSTTAESPTTQTSTTAESPTSQTSTTAESPTTQTSTTAESPTTQTSTTAESPTTQTSTTAESPTTQTSTTAESPTTQPMNTNTALTTVYWNQTRNVNSTVTKGFTSPTSYATGTIKNIMNVTTVDPKTDFQPTIATGTTGSSHPVTLPAKNSSKNVTVTDIFEQSSTTTVSPTTKQMSENQTKSVSLTFATGASSPASNGIGTTNTSVDPKTTFQTTLATGVTGSKHPVTLPAKSIACAVCSGPEFLCEKLYAIKQCDPPNNYCINKLYNHIDGSRIVTRQCGNFDTCYRDWYLGSSDSDKCRKFNEHSILTLDFTCTYCCINDNCNKPIRPDYDSLYIDE